jgi:hypothetical protein
LVTTGNPFSTSVKSEVIDLEDSNNICQDLEDYPIQVWGAVGGLLNQVDPLVCGGGYSSYTNVCYVLNQPGQSSEMLEERVYSATLTLNSTHIWITGGYNGNGILQTSEFVSIGQSAVKGPDLPYAVERHCAMSSERDSFAKGKFSTFAKGFLLHKLWLKVNYSPLRVKKSRSHDMGQCLVGVNSSTALLCGGDNGQYLNGGTYLSRHT